MQVTIITHGGVAHADETFAAGMLTMAHPDHRVNVIRTRTTALYREQAGAPLTFLLDVGGVYDPARRLFDHHQRAGAGYRAVETREWPYATAGLVWLHYGAKVVQGLYPSLTEAETQEVVQHVDISLLRYIDAVDCGVPTKTIGPSVSGIFASFNPPWFDEETSAESFELMKQLAQAVLTNFIKRYVGKILARNLVRASEVVQGGAVLVLTQCMPWSDVVVREMPEVKLVVFPVENEKWQIRVAQNSDHTPRIALPQEWAGQEGESFERVTGVEGAVFCHRSGHLAGTETQDGILRLAEIAIKQYQPVFA